MVCGRWLPLSTQLPCGTLYRRDIGGIDIDKLLCYNIAVILFFEEVRYA